MKPLEPQSWSQSTLQQGRITHVGGTAKGLAYSILTAMAKWRPTGLSGRGSQDCKSCYKGAAFAPWRGQRPRLKPQSGNTIGPAHAAGSVAAWTPDLVTRGGAAR